MLPSILVVAVIAVVAAVFVGLVEKRHAARRKEKAGGRKSPGFHGRYPGRVVFRLCPDCAELLYLDVRACKYCGAVLPATESKEPNKAPEPTPGSVTPRAND